MVTHFLILFNSGLYEHFVMLRINFILLFMLSIPYIYSTIELRIGLDFCDMGDALEIQYGDIYTYVYIMYMYVCAQIIVHERGSTLICKLVL